VLTEESNFSTQRQVIYPSQAGGHDWMPMSYSETEHLVFVPAMDAGMTFAMIPGKDVHFRPAANNEGDVMGWAPPGTGSHAIQLREGQWVSLGPGAPNP